MAIGRLCDRINQERQREQKSDVDRASRQARQRAEAGDDQLVRRERKGNIRNDLRRDAGQLPLDAGFVECGDSSLGRGARQVGSRRHRCPRAWRR